MKKYLSAADQIRCGDWLCLQQHCCALRLRRPPELPGGKRKPSEEGLKPDCCVPRLFEEFDDGRQKVTWRKTWRLLPAKAVVRAELGITVKSFSRKQVTENSNETPQQRKFHIKKYIKFTRKPPVGKVSARNHRNRAFPRTDLYVKSWLYNWKTLPCTLS